VIWKARTVKAMIVMDTFFLSRVVCTFVHPLLMKLLLEKFLCLHIIQPHGLYSLYQSMLIASAVIAVPFVHVAPTWKCVLFLAMQPTTKVTPS